MPRKARNTTDPKSTSTEPTRTDKLKTQFTQLNLEALLVLSPGSHFGFTVGPLGDVGLGGLYTEKNAREEITEEVTKRIEANRFLTKADFEKLCRWKTRGRTEHWYKENEESFIKVVTHTAFSTQNDRFRIVSLAALKGVAGQAERGSLCRGAEVPHR